MDLEEILRRVDVEKRERVRALILKPDKRMVESRDVKIIRREFPAKLRLVEIFPNTVKVYDLESGNFIGSVGGRNLAEGYFHINLETGEVREFANWREAEEGLPKVHERCEICDRLERVHIGMRYFLVDHEGRRAWDEYMWCSDPQTIEEVEEAEGRGEIVIDRKDFYRPIDYEEVAGYIEAEREPIVMPLPEKAFKLIELYNMYFTIPFGEEPIRAEDFKYVDPRSLHGASIYRVERWKRNYEDADYAPAFHKIFKDIYGVWEASYGHYWADDYTILETDAGIFLVRTKGYFEGYSMEMFTVKDDQLYEVKTPASTKYDSELGLIVEKSEAVMYEKVEMPKPETVEEIPSLLEEELEKLEKREG